MNRKQLVEILAMHLYNRFGPQSTKIAFPELDYLSRQNWLSEADSTLVITGFPEDPRDSLVKSMVSDVKTAGELNWQFTSPDTIVVLLSSSIIDMNPFENSWKIERLLRACGVTREEFEKDRKSVVGHEVNARVETQVSVKSGISRLRVINYEVYDGNIYNGKVFDNTL